MVRRETVLSRNITYKWIIYSKPQDGDGEGPEERNNKLKFTAWWDDDDGS